jgi:cation diffusion facilitator family transporter
MASPPPAAPATTGAINRVLLIVLGLNLAVAAAKLIAGTLANSASMLADGFHSVADGSNNLIGLVGVFIASRPADRKHPYGHRKFETFTAIILTFLLFLVSFNVLKAAVVRLRAPVPVAVDASLWAFLVMGGTMLVNGLTARYERRAGRRLASDILVADAAHTRSDLYVSLSVIGSLVAARLGSRWLDPVASLAIAAFIAKTGVNILNGACNVLCDAQVVDPQAVHAVVTTIPGVRGCHQIRSRGRQDDFALDLHVLVDPKLSIGDVHALDHAIKSRLEDACPGVHQIFLHMEPCQLSPATGAPPTD